MMCPLVSVIIPNYNHARYLDQRLQSVLGQTYPNFEVIILDDKSTDNSLEVIDKYAEDPHISMIVENETNSGRAFLQWDKGISLARGEIIWIAESDDYCERNFLEEVVNAYCKHKGSTLAYTSLKVVDDDGNLLESDKTYRSHFLRGSSFVRRYLTLANFVRNASGAVFSKEAALNVPKDYQAYKGAGDYLFWVQIALQGRVAIVNKRLSYFRRHNGTVTSSRDFDGSNFIEERQIFNYIKSQTLLSRIRIVGVFCYHWRRIKNQQFISDSVRSKVYEVWGVPEQYSFHQKVVLKAQGYFINKHNLFL